MPCDPPILHAYIYSSNSQLANFLEEPEVSTSIVIKRLYKKYQRGDTRVYKRRERDLPQERIRRASQRRSTFLDVAWDGET